MVFRKKGFVMAGGFVLAVTVAVFCTSTVKAESFSSQQIISTNVDGAYSIYAADLDGDGDADLLSASHRDDKIAWYENQGDGDFGTQQVISSAADGAYSVYAADLDGDGDADVLSANGNDKNLAWYENQGDGTFGNQHTISTGSYLPYSVYAADLDGDGDPDLLSVSHFSSASATGVDWWVTIAWYENQGGMSFGSKQTINSGTSSTPWHPSVYPADLDGDGDVDLLSEDDSRIAWYENQGGGNFGGPFADAHAISTEVVSASSVFAADIDSDGDVDALSASRSDDKIAWYENQGGGNFGEQQVISTEADEAQRVFAADLDGDGDPDVLSAAANGLAWYENQGAGSFGGPQMLDTKDTWRVYATDLDSDSDSDVLAIADDNIVWYENLLDPVIGPEAPTGLTATAGDGTVALSWNAVSDATGYNVYRSETTGSGFTKVNTERITGTTYEDTTVENGITYYYYVTALKDSIESSASSEVSGTPTAEEPDGGSSGDGSGGADGDTGGGSGGGGGGGCFISGIMRK